MSSNKYFKENMEEMEFLCPKCHIPILDENFDFDKIKVTCPGCSAIFKLDEIISDPVNYEDYLKRCPPTNSKVTHDNGITGIEVSVHGCCALIILGPFSAVWAGGSTWIIYGLQFVDGKFELYRSIVGLPFLIGSIVLTYICFYMAFGKMRLTLSGMTLKTFQGFWKLGLTKTYDFESIKQVAVEKRQPDNENDDYWNLVLYGSFANGKEKIKLFSSTDRDNLEYIRMILMEEKNLPEKIE